MQIPSLVYANSKGEIFDHPTLKMTMRAANYDLLPYDTELIELPPTSRLYFMPDTNAVGYSLEKARTEVLKDSYAVSVFLPPSYLRLFLPSYRKTKEYTMPLYAYTAVGWVDGKFVVPAIKVDDDSRWHPDLYDYTDSFKSNVDEYLKKYPENRLYTQLAKCALEYHCTAAKNVFYPRWECPVPTAPTCNSRCVGCISLQPSECCPSPQQRIPFMPSPKEIAEIALNHAAKAEFPIISFGQGCEGDPITAADNIAEAVKIIRQTDKNLTINFNSNCSIPENVKKVIDAGVNSIRVSLNSVIPETYNSYYNPVNYTFADVCKSIKIANEKGVYVALNLLTMPGMNDRKSEVDALTQFLTEHRVELIQLRNLNIDAELLFSKFNWKIEELLSIKNMIKHIKKKHPHIKFGYFNRIKEDFFVDRGLPDLKVKKIKR